MKFAVYKSQGPQEVEGWGGGKFAVHNIQGPQEVEGTRSLLSTTVKNLIRRLKVQEVCYLQQYSRTSVW